VLDYWSQHIHSGLIAAKALHFNPEEFLYSLSPTTRDGILEHIQKRLAPAHLNYELTKNWFQVPDHVGGVVGCLHSWFTQTTDYLFQRQIGITDSWDSLEQQRTRHSVWIYRIQHLPSSITFDFEIGTQGDAFPEWINKRDAHVKLIHVSNPSRQGQGITLSRVLNKITDLLLYQYDFRALWGRVCEDWDKPVFKYEHNWRADLAQGQITKLEMLYYRNGWIPCLVDNAGHHLNEDEKIIVRTHPEIEERLIEQQPAIEQFKSFRRNEYRNKRQIIGTA
jgi:hypothetical protein